MLCAVIQTHHAGERLPRQRMRLDSPAVGNLLLSDHEGNAQRRGKYARLAHHGPSVRADLLLPIFDVQLIRIVAEGFLLQGYEIDIQNGVAREVVQGWWCKPVQAQEP